MGSPYRLDPAHTAVPKGNPREEGYWVPKIAELRPVHKNLSLITKFIDSLRPVQKNYVHITLQKIIEKDPANAWSLEVRYLSYIEALRRAINNHQAGNAPLHSILKVTEAEEHLGEFLQSTKCFDDPSIELTNIIKVLRKEKYYNR